MNKFKVGDKVRVFKSGKDLEGFEGSWVASRMDRYVGKTFTIAEVIRQGNAYTFEETLLKDMSPIFDERVLEKEMFDMKKEPWYVKASEENFQAVVNWLKYKGFEFPSSFRCYREIYITNKSSSGTLVDRCEWAMYERTVSCKAKEIKLSFKTETTVANVEYPETLTEKEIETRKIREEMEALAERLKKLENS